MAKATIKYLNRAGDIVEGRLKPVREGNDVTVSVALNSGYASSAVLAAIIAAGGPTGPRSGPPHAEPQQAETNRPGDAQLPRRLWRISRARQLREEEASTQLAGACLAISSIKPNSTKNFTSTNLGTANTIRS